MLSLCATAAPLPRLVHNLAQLCLLGVIGAHATAADVPAGTPPPRAADDATSAGAPAPATPPAQDTAALARRVQALEDRLQVVEADHATQTGAPAIGNGPLALQFGLYGELKAGVLQNPAANGQWQTGFDGGRLTLLPSCQLSPSIILRAEIEFEHGGISPDADDKLDGTVEIEQAYVDWTVNEHLHWRPPGIDVVPIGYTNLFHEPTLFYSVQRPELANGLVPTTWYEGATSIHGVLWGPVTYQFQVSTSLVDDGSYVGDTTEAGTAPNGYPPGITGTTALAFARSSTSGFQQESNELGYALRFAVAVPGVSGLNGSVSAYVSPNVEPRGAYAVATGDPLGRCALVLEDAEARYRPGEQGIELRAEIVGVEFSHPSQLRANNDGDPTDNVGRAMWGASGEIAWHGRWGTTLHDIVPFYRYTFEDLQTAGTGGTDANAPTGAGQQQYHTLGIAFFPTPELVLKIDGQIARDRSSSGPHADHILGGVGVFF